MGEGKEREGKGRERKAKGNRGEGEGKGGRAVQRGQARVATWGGGSDVECIGVVAVVARRDRDGCFEIGGAGGSVA